MDWRYWLELPLIVGLATRFFADIMAGSLWGDGLADAEHRDAVASERFIVNGTRLQIAPSFWHPEYGPRALAFYAAVMAYWGFVFVHGFVDTIAQPGPVFGALGVPPIVMQGVAWANAGVLFALAGIYAADAADAFTE